MNDSSRTKAKTRNKGPYSSHVIIQLSIFSGPGMSSDDSKSLLESIWSTFPHLDFEASLHGGHEWFVHSLGNGHVTDMPTDILIPDD